jgi:hypothetical protein
MRSKSLALPLAASVALSGGAASAQTKTKIDERRHPSLYFGADDVEALRARWKRPPFAERMARLLVNADECLRRPPTPGRSTEQQTSRDALGVTALCAFAWVATGRRDYAERARHEAFRLLDDAPWYVDKDWNHGAELCTAECALACGLCYDWCFDTFSDPERRDFVAKLVARGISPYLDAVEKWKDWWVANPVTNWCGVLHGGCGVAALAIRDQSPEARRACEIARRQIPQFLDAVITADGGGHEGVMYWRYGVEYACFFATAARRLLPGRDLDAVFDSFQRKCAGYWDVAMQAPDGGYANFNDMNEGSGLYGADPRAIEGGPSSTLCALFESGAPGAGDETLRFGADMGGTSFFFNGTSPFWFLWRSTRPPVAARSVPPALLFRDCGHVVWSNGPLWFAYNGGWISDKSHAQFDLGTFVLVCDGERFVADAGYGVNATADHSTVGIDGQDQPKGARAEYLAYATSDRWRYFISDLSKCYGPSLRRYRRHVVMVGDRFLVLVDDLSSSGAPKYDWRLQTRLAASVHGSVATIAGRKSALAVVAAAPANAHLEVGKGALSYVSITPAKAEGDELFVTVLAPEALGAAAPDAEWKVKGASATLTVRRGVTTDSLEFRLSPALELAKVDHDVVDKLAPPKDRTFQRIASR